MKFERAFVTMTGLGLAAVLAVAVSCKGTENETAPPAEASAGPAWKDMTREQRGAFMKQHVLPEMKAAFAAFDAEEFGEMNCATCHGAGAKDKTFTMPNPKLPHLPTDDAGWKALEAKEPAAVKFMRETVVPRMAALLREAPYDPATHEGFGCFECHTPRPK